MNSSVPSIVAGFELELPLIRTFTISRQKALAKLLKELAENFDDGRNEVKNDQAIDAWVRSLAR